MKARSAVLTTVQPYILETLFKNLPRLTQNSGKYGAES